MRLRMRRDARPWRARAIGCVLALLNDIDPVAVTITPLRHVTRSRRACSYDCTVSLIGRVFTHASFLAVQQHRQRERVMHVGGACRHRLNDLRARLSTPHERQVWRRGSARRGSICATTLLSNASRRTHHVHANASSRRPPGWAERRSRSSLQRLTRSILPQAIGKVTYAGIGPSEATDAGSLLVGTTPWMKTTRRSRSSI